MIRRTIVVRVPPARAFDCWHRQIHLWWPPGHRRAAGQMVLEPEAGGRLFERASDGRELPVGRVRTFEPPHRLELDFYLGTGVDAPTRCEIRFTAVDGGTRVELVHGPGDHVDAFHKVAPRFHDNWDAILAAFTTFLGAT